MHSRIFQVSTEKEFERASEVDYYENFVGSIADCVNDVDDKEAICDIMWLEKYLKGAVKFSDDYSTMTIVNKRLYFEPLYKEFKAALDKLCSKVSEDEFCDGKIGMEMWSLNNAYNDKFGFYISKEYPITLTEFMTEVKDGDTFYMGTVTDYHC